MLSLIRIFHWGVWHVVLLAILVLFPITFKPSLAQTTPTTSQEEGNQIFLPLTSVDSESNSPTETGDEGAPFEIINPGDQQNRVGDTVDLLVSVSTEGDTPLSYSAEGLPSGLSIENNTGVITGLLSQTGSFNCTVIVENSNSESTRASFTWTILPPINSQPIVTNPGSQISIVGDSVNLAIIAADTDNNSLTFSASGLPNGLEIDQISGLIRGIPTVPGSVNVMITVNDGHGGVTQITFVWNVNRPANLPPILMNPGNQGNVVGDSINLTLMASDPNGDNLIFSASRLPNGLDIDQSSGAIKGIINSDGLFDVTVIVNDGNGGEDRVSFIWSVTSPTIVNTTIEVYARGSIGGEIMELSIDGQGVQSWTVTSESQIFAYTHDANVVADQIRLSFGNDGQDPVTNKDRNLIVDKITVDGVVYETEAPNVSSMGVWNGSDCRTAAFHLSQMLACDGYFQFASGLVNRPPYLQNPGSQVSSTDEPVVLVLNATDLDGDPLIFSATGLPEGLTIDDSSGLISGTPTTIGTSNVTVHISDGNGGQNIANFTWAVGEGPLVGCSGLIQEAEDAQISGRFVIGTSGVASGGRFVQLPQESGNQLNGPSADRIDFCFNVIEAGLYRLSSTILATGDGNNSFYIAIDGQPAEGYLWDTATDQDNYITDYVNQRGGTDPVEFNLSVGEHIVTVYAREDGTILDKLELELMNRQPIVPICNGLVREAEDAILRGGFIVGMDENASGGRFVHLPNGTGNNLTGTAIGDSAEYCFTVHAAGTYLLEGTILATGSGNDSLYVIIDDQSAAGYLWDTATNADFYIQDFLNDRGNADPVQLTLNAGVHTIIVYPREDGTLLDKLALVDTSTE